jgi:cbb3-type cytochrome oxidase maturation protein
MNIVYFMMPLAFGLGLGFVVAFVRMAMTGQYDDLETPAYRILLEEEEEQP